MSIPNNIKKDHLLAAIEKIDREGIPTDADSQYYDVVYNGKRYPPKLIVSYANEFANGSLLDRSTFSGGMETPAFRLLEKEGFRIEKKSKMKKVKLYDIHGSSAIEHFDSLLTDDEKYFYWDSNRFKKYDVTDVVFWVNRSKNIALYSKVDSVGVDVSYKDGKNLISDQGYNVYAKSPDENRFEGFYRFKIIEKRIIPSDWNYSNPSPFDGQPMAIILLEEKVDDPYKKIEKINDLLDIFDGGEAFHTLEEAKSILKNMVDLNPDIISAIKSPRIQDLVNSEEFYYGLAKQKFDEFKEFTESSPEFYANLLDSFDNKNIRFTEFMSGFAEEQKEYKFLLLVAELVSYCDTNAANKNTLNQNSDKRVLAKSGVYQNDWLRNLLKFKMNGNDSTQLTSSVKNALDYLNNSLLGLTMLSNNHREMVSKNLLKETEFNSNSIVEQVFDYFKPFNINPKNPLNLGVILSNLLYHFPKIKKLWYDKVEGLIVCDNTGWIEKALLEFPHFKLMAFWWDKSPSGGARTLKLLQEAIDNSETNSFHIYYSVNQKAKYRSRVIDFATAKDYPDKNWNRNNDVGWYHSNFSEYSETNSRGNISSAKIVFLVDELIKFEEPIGMENFQFYGDFLPPTQNNMQPFVEVNIEISAPRKVWFVCQGASYSDERGKKYLWAPSKDKTGSPRLYWENVSKVKTGDIIFNYSDGIRGVSVATTDGYTSKNPFPEPNWNEDGYKVDIRLIELSKVITSQEISIRKEEFNSALRNIQNKPFNVDGKVNQGYLYEFNKEAGRLIREINNQLFGDEEIDSFFGDSKVSVEPPTMEPKEVIRHVYQYITYQGFKFKFEEIANFYLALKTKPFVILAGISGTGKTKLPRKFAEALGMSSSQVKQVAVRPDWTDGSELLGYIGLDGKYKPKYLTEVILVAKNHPSLPYFFILDEMNLARVEHYFSDFLSVIETREKEGGMIKTDLIIKEESIKDASNVDVYKNLQWPQNLYLIGTVNMDETTHTFSRKVLDRANSIEMNEVDLRWTTSSGEKPNKLNGITNSFFSTEYISSVDISQEDKQSIQDKMEILQNINNILKRADLHFAYRIRDEVAFYLILNSKYQLLESEKAFDYQLMQKILPRIHGSSERVQKVLVELFNLLEGTSFNSDEFDFDQSIKKIDWDNIKYKRSANKIIFMLKRFEEDRFTSFWL
jgi:hypothetical protein